MSWEITRNGKLPVFNNPILVVGLPGIGNVGKIVVDFLKVELKARKILEFSSCELPHTVFVNEKNLVELPSIQLYCVKIAKQDLLLLVGDAQPIHEMACYDFCETVIKVAKEINCKEIITLGGIALRQVPKKPQLYCVGADKRDVSEFVKGSQVKTDLYGVVGPIIGVTGVLAGLASKHGLMSVILLAETYAHPMFLGIAGAKEILQMLCKKLDLKLNLDSLEREIKEMEEEAIKLSQDIANLQQGSLPKFRGKFGKETSYIG